MTRVTNSELARELDASPASMTHLLKTGVLKSLPDGKINRLAALRAIAKSTSGHGGGWTGEARGKLSLQERAEALLNPTKAKQSGPSMDPFAPLFALGMAHVCKCLRDGGRFDALRDLTIEATGISRKQALEATLGFVAMTHFWIQDVVAESLGKKYARTFDRELAGWIKTFGEKGTSKIGEGKK